MGAGDKYIPNGVWLRCDKGVKPGKLTVLPRRVRLYGESWATQYDAVPYVNIPSFGVCSIIKVCAPATVMWEDVLPNVRINGQAAILDTSTCPCSVGGTIKIYFTRQAADDAAGEQDAKEQADFWGKVGMGLLVAGAVVGAAVIIVGSGGTALAVLGAAVATGATVGGVGGAVAGGISGGAEGAVKGLFMGAAFGALGGIATATGAGLVAGALALGAAGAGLASLGFLGKAFYHNPSRKNGLVLVGAVAGIAAGGLTAKGISMATAPKTSTVYRAQGGTPPKNVSRHRIQIDENGNASINGRTMVHVGIDNKSHAVYFYNKRGGAGANAEITSFKIPKRVADQIRREAVPQIDGKKFPNAPQIDDPTVGPDLYGLPKEWIDILNRESIPGSGRVTKPK